MLNKEEEMLLQLLLKKYGLVTRQVEDVVQVEKPKIIRKRKAQRSDLNWNLDEIKQLVDMHIQNIHTLTIARTICRSHTAVRTMKSHLFGNRTKRPPLVKKFWEKYLHEPFYAAYAPEKI